jgi:hypothetical protein
VLDGPEEVLDEVVLEAFEHVLVLSYHEQESAQFLRHLGPILDLNISLQLALAGELEFVLFGGRRGGAVVGV